MTPFEYTPFPGPSQERTRQLFINNPLVRVMPDVPDRLLSIMFAGCSDMKQICETRLPGELRDLAVLNCEKLASLPSLPDGLKYLRINECPLLTKLPPLPASLQYLWLSNLPLLSGTVSSSIPNVYVEACPGLDA